MVTGIVTSSGNIGYRDQLDRARRFLERVEHGPEDVEDVDEVQFQDNMWSFFQHCWHIKDWVRHDPLMSEATKDAVIAAAHQSKVLAMCQDLCNATKHLRLNKTAARASHKHVETVIAPSQGRYEHDLIVDDGHGGQLSGKKLARDCIADWERILTDHGLAIARRS